MPLLIVTLPCSVPVVPPAPICSVPALIVVVTDALRLLLPERMNVELPLFVKLIGPLNCPAYVVLEVGFTVNVQVPEVVTRSEAGTRLARPAIDCEQPLRFNVPPLSVNAVALGMLLAFVGFSVPLVIVVPPAQEFVLPLSTVVPLEKVTPELLVTLRLLDKVMVLPLTPLIVNAPPAMFPLIALETVVAPPELEIWAVPVQLIAPLYVPFPLI